jgi:hypothetical protein
LYFFYEVCYEALAHRNPVDLYTLSLRLLMSLSNIRTKQAKAESHTIFMHTINLFIYKFWSLKHKIDISEREKKINKKNQNEKKKKNEMKQKN